MRRQRLADVLARTLADQGDVGGPSTEAKCDERENQLVCSLHCAAATAVDTSSLDPLCDACLASRKDRAQHHISVAEAVDAMRLSAHQCLDAVNTELLVLAHTGPGDEDVVRRRIADADLWRERQLEAFRAWELGRARTGLSDWEASTAQAIPGHLDQVVALVKAGLSADESSRHALTASLEEFASLLPVFAEAGAQGDLARSRDVVASARRLTTALRSRELRLRSWAAVDRSLRLPHSIRFDQAKGPLGLRLALKDVEAALRYVFWFRHSRECMFA